MKLLCPWCLGELPGKPGQVAKCRNCTSEIFWGGDEPFKTEEEALSASQATPDFEAATEGDIVPPPVPKKTPEDDFSDNSWLTSDSPWTTGNLSPDVAENFAETDLPNVAEEHQHPESLEMPTPPTRQLAPTFRDLYRKEIEAYRKEIEAIREDSLEEQLIGLDDWWIIWGWTISAVFSVMLCASATGLSMSLAAKDLEAFSFFLAIVSCLLLFLPMLLYRHYSATSNIRKRVDRALLVANAGVGLSCDLVLQTELIKGLTTKQAEALAKHEVDLSLDGLTTITPEVAEALAKHKGDLSLDGLTTITPDVAVALAKHKGEWLHLNGLTTITPEVAEALAKYEGWLSLVGLTELNAVALAKALTKHEYSVSPDGLLESHTLGFARAIAKHRRRVSLDRLTTITPAVAEVLAKHKGMLLLDGLTTITPEVAEALAKHKGVLHLNGLTELTPEVAEALAKYQGWLALSGLTELNSVSLARKLASTGESLYLDGLTTITPQVYLNGLTTITPEVAEALAKYRGVLYLNGLTTLTPEVAEALGKHEGGLRLDGLITITPEALKMLRANPYILIVLPSEFDDKP
jgi:hypothetical protein